MDPSSAIGTQYVVWSVIHINWPGVSDTTHPPTVSCSVRLQKIENCSVGLLLGLLVGLSLGLRLLEGLLLGTWLGSTESVGCEVGELDGAEL